MEYVVFSRLWLNMVSSPRPSFVLANCCFQVNSKMSIKKDKVGVGEEVHFLLLARYVARVAFKCVLKQQPKQMA